MEIAEEWQTLITGAVLPLLSPPEGRPRVSSEKESRTIQTKYNVNKTGIKIVHAFGSVRFGIYVITAYYHRFNVCECQIHIPYDGEKKGNEGSLHCQLIFKTLYISCESYNTRRAR